MKKKQYIFFSAIIGLLLSSCISEFTPVLSDEYAELLIIEGNIRSEDVSRFYVGETVGLETDTKLSAAKVDVTLTVIGENGYESEPAAYTKDGLYEVQTALLDVNVGYAVRVKNKNQTYQSDFAKPLVTPPITDFSFAQNERWGDVSFRVSTSSDDSSEPYYSKWFYEEVWEEHASHPTSAFFDLATGEYYHAPGLQNFICWKTKEQHENLITTTETFQENKLFNYNLFSINPNDIRFAFHYKIILRQQRISQETYIYYKNLNTTNEEMGGLFTPQPSEIKSNIRCVSDPSRKVIGNIAVAKNRTEYSLYIKPGDIIRDPDIEPCKLFSHGDLQKATGATNYKDFYHFGYRPVGRLEVNLYTGEVYIAISGWTYEECVDCVVNGGSLEKPADWPN